MVVSGGNGQVGLTPAKDAPGSNPGSRIIFIKKWKNTNTKQK